MDTSQTSLSVSTSQSAAEEDSALQKPLFYNQFLPYYSALATEAEQLLRDIKKNLSLAVQRHELIPGAIFWTHRLSRYDTLALQIFYMIESQSTRDCQ